MPANNIRKGRLEPVINAITRGFEQNNKRKRC
jgi:hypothetical protein